MTDTGQPLKFIDITFPEMEQPTLTVQVMESGALYRFELSRDQLFRLNAATADAIWKGKPR